jgi:hypothetical protein
VDGKKKTGLADVPEPERQAWQARSLPRIEDRETKLIEILHIARDERKTVFQSRRRDHAVSRTQRSPGQLPCPAKPAPSRRNRLRYGQNPSREQNRQMPLERLFQTRSPRDILHGRKSSFQFADAHDTQKQCVLAQHEEYIDPFAGIAFGKASRTETLTGRVWRRKR